MHGWDAAGAGSLLQGLGVWRPRKHTAVCVAGQMRRPGLKGTSHAMRAPVRDPSLLITPSAGDQGLLSCFAMLVKPVEPHLTAPHRKHPQPQSTQHRGQCRMNPPSPEPQTHWPPARRLARLFVHWLRCWRPCLGAKGGLASKRSARSCMRGRWLVLETVAHALERIPIHVQHKHERTCLRTPAHATPRSP